jgi:pyridoxamine 5'-phosphate oxidase
VGKFISMSHPIADIRTDYKLQSLSEKDVAENPIAQFSKWWKEAIDSQIDEVNAMVLATADANGIPSARIVLLKDFDEKGFVFFTNYQSKKGQDIAANPNVSLVFFWKELERQVNICGSIEKISAEESDNYFQSRPEGSRIGAWASPQSTVIADRNIIENNFHQYQEKFGANHIPKPDHWGGYLVKPNSVEFWQGRSSRLHDRLKYRSTAEGIWILERLAP